MPPRYAVLIVATLGACSGLLDDAAYDDLGILQVRVHEVAAPDTARSGDTLIASLTGRPDTGNCFTFQRADIERDGNAVRLTLWARATQWLHGTPPPCGLVGYVLEVPPPLAPGWFRLLTLQPDGTTRVDSVPVVPWEARHEQIRGSCRPSGAPLRARVNARLGLSVD
jgi:hypothetical protein